MEPLSSKDYEAICVNAPVFERCFLSSCKFAAINQILTIKLDESLIVCVKLVQISDAKQSRYGNFCENSQVEIKNPSNESYLEDLSFSKCEFMQFFNLLTGEYKPESNCIFVSRQKYLEWKKCFSVEVSFLVKNETELKYLFRVDWIDGTDLDCASCYFVVGNKQNAFFNGCYGRITKIYNQDSQSITHFDQVVPLKTNKYFEEFFPDIQWGKTAIVGIKGGFLSGKSFIVNNFLADTHVSCILIKDCDFAQVHSILEYYSMIKQYFAKLLFFIIDDFHFQFQEGFDAFVNMKRLARIATSLKGKNSWQHLKIIFTWNSTCPIPEDLSNTVDKWICVPKMNNEDLKAMVKDSCLFEKFCGLSTGKTLDALRYKEILLAPSEQDEKFANNIVVGYEEVKEALVRFIEWPIMFERLFKACKLDQKCGIVLFGPPGCGKTLIACQWAASIHPKIKTYVVRGPELISKYIGSTEQAIRALFEQARQTKPSLIVFDEFDAIASRRGEDHSGITDRIVNQFLTELDGVTPLEGVFVLATTSRLDVIDPALVRPGRLGVKILVDYPSTENRMQILQHLNSCLSAEHAFDDADLKNIVLQTSDFSCADLYAIFRELDFACLKEKNASKDQLLRLTFETVEKIKFKNAKNQSKTQKQERQIPGSATAFQ